MMNCLLSTGLLAFAVAACSSTSEGAPCDGPDKQEPNDTPATARDMGSFTDEPDSSLRVDLTVHSNSDVDYLKFHVFDKGIGGDPIVTISAPEGYEITTWFTCDRGSPKTFTCMRGKEVTDPDSAGKGCQNEQPSGSVSSTTDCDADSDDDGVVLVRVKKLDRSNVCSSAFNITIEVE